MADALVAQKSPFVEQTEPGTYYWCACGRSGDQPFCDGAHKGTGFVPLEHQVVAAAPLAWCGCKATKTPPFCDGSHRAL